MTRFVRGVVCGLVGACSAAAVVPAIAQKYPVKPIEVTVHTSAGSGGDIVSRAVGEIIRKDSLLPQGLVVVNRVGGGGAIGHGFFRTKRGDPYHMMSVTGTILVMAYRSDIGIGLENYTPIALMTIDPQTIMVPATSPYKTFKELAEAIRAKGDLVGATTSATGTGRLVIHLMEKHIPGAKIRFVTFKGGGEAMTSTAGGHTAFTTENLGEGAGFVEAKTLRVLAVTTDKRLPQYPDVPTLQELGYPITAGTIRGFTFTAGVPKEAVSTMEATLKKVHDSPEWKDIVKRNIYQDIFMGSEQFSKFLRARMEEYREFYDAIGLNKMK